jgi:hypothetical protein
MHRPETWGYVQFATAPAGIAKFQPDPTGPARHLLHQVLYAQHQFHHQHDRWASNLHELGLEKLAHASLSAPISLQTKGTSFVVTTEVRLEEGKAVKLHLHQDAKLKVQ